MIHPTEEDLEEYRRQDREDKGIAHLEERRRREPPIGDPCGECGGNGAKLVNPPNDCDFIECPRCHGTKVEP